MNLARRKKGGKIWEILRPDLRPEQIRAPGSVRFAMPRIANLGNDCLVMREGITSRSDETLLSVWQAQRCLTLDREGAKVEAGTMQLL